MARVRVLSWRDIPSQVKVVDEAGGTATAQLPPAFQQRIDREAMRLGLAGTDDYLEQWAWSTEEERPGSADEVLAAVLEELGAAAD
jgi:hypothetical protein